MSTGKWTRVIALILAVAPCAGGGDDPIARADTLFARRDDRSRLRESVEALESRLAAGDDRYDVLWRLARSRFYLADRETAAAVKLGLLDQALDAARRASSSRSDRPEGHFWLAKIQGDRARSQGGMKALALLPEIRSSFARSLKADPRYANGAAWEELGDLDVRVPAAYGGDVARGVARLEHGRSIAPSNSDLVITLAGAYLKIGRKDDARHLAEEALSLSDPGKTPDEQAHIRDKAQHLMEQLR